MRYIVLDTNCLLQSLPSKSPYHKIWIEENGKKKIEVCWSELNAKDESAIIDVIDKNWDAINDMINKVFAGESVDIIKIRKK